jgi:sulfur relay (sulfurtransferase) complex TusBCD TusD component (DsrE family)
MKKSLLAIGFAIVAATFAANRSLASDDDAPSPAPQTVVHLSHYTDDLHAAFMALKLATAMQQSGGKVVMFVDLEGVRAADGRQPNDLGWGHSGDLASYYDAFVKAGGSVLVCPHCAKAAGISTGDLRPGAHIGTEQEVAATLSASDRILDY